MKINCIKAAPLAACLLLTGMAALGQPKPVSGAGSTPGPHDTIYVSTEMTTYMVFPEPISVWDLGSKSYAAKIESRNMLYLKPLKAHTSISSLLVQTVDGTIYLNYIAYRKFPHQLFWDYRTARAAPASTSGDSLPAQEEKLQNVSAHYAQQIEFLRSQKKGNLLMRSSNRMRLRVSHLAIDSGATYLLLDVHNRSSIPFQVQYVGFAYKEPRSKKSRKRIDPEQSQVEPLFSEGVAVISPQKREQLAYVLPLFAPTWKGYLEITISEENGNRVLKGKLRATRLAKALYLQKQPAKTTSHVPANP